MAEITFWMMNSTMYYGITYAVCGGFGTVRFRLRKGQIFSLVAVIIIAYILQAECMVAFHGTTMNTVTRYCIMVFQVYVLSFSFKNVKANLAAIDEDIEYLNEMANPIDSCCDQANQSYGSSIDVSFESNLASERHGSNHG